MSAQSDASNPGIAGVTEWQSSWRADLAVRPLADRHYNRQSIGADQFVPPGRCLVLKALTPEFEVGAFWITSWPFAEFVKHEWPGAWMCSAFRNERPDLWKSSELIRAAVAATRWLWATRPALGMVTFVDAGKVKPKRDPGYCYLMAGFELAGMTAGGLRALQMLPSEMPDACAPLGSTMALW